MIKVNLQMIKVVLAGCLIIGLTSACSLLPKEEEALKPPLVKPVQENLETFEVKVGSIVKRIKGIGNFEATEIKYHQYKDAGGTVMEMVVRAGDFVEKGDLLIQLEVQGLDEHLKVKQIEMFKANLGLNQAKQEQNVDLMKLRMMEYDLAKLQYDKAVEQFESKQLIAEMSGVVTFAADLKPGDWVEPYRILVSVADTSQMRLTYQVVSLADIADVQVGMDAEVTYKNEPFTAKVVQTPSSAPFVENEQLREKYAKTLYLEMETIPEDAEFGSLADINIVTEKRDDTLIIPARGLRTYFGRDYVQVLDGESRTEIDVEKGIESATEVEILTGLKEGQQIILQ